jgi:hypothetical protein
MEAESALDGFEFCVLQPNKTVTKAKNKSFFVFIIYFFGYDYLCISAANKTFFRLQNWKLITKLGNYSGVAKGLMVSGSFE